MARHPGRRAVLRALAAGAGVLALPRWGAAQAAPVVTKPIPSTGEALPVIGLGTWVTFNVGNDAAARDSCAEVMRAFFRAGGRMIDSSPMYGSAEEVIGYGLKKLGMPKQLFSATKVWTSSRGEGSAQIAASERLWGIPKFDLEQVHNLLSWEAHLETLAALKSEGRIRYVGITTSEGRRHDDFEKVMRTRKLDFVQVTYNVRDREVEDRILPLAAERGMAVIVNRPFRRGTLIAQFEKRSLPAWAGEIGCANWAQFLLKFAVSHPVVTCAIPATSRVDHVEENMAAATGPMPDAAMRARMIDYVKNL
ncbi:MAG: aldo/keto reductase [Alphaproteobacteria bacterium]